MAETEDLGIGLASQVDIHLILHEEGAMVDSRSLVQLFDHEFIVLELRVHFQDALLDKV